MTEPIWSGVLEHEMSMAWLIRGGRKCDDLCRCCITQSVVMVF